MQSWQTDLLNLQLTLTVKPMFKYIKSLDRLRQMVSFSDNTVGRLAIPRGTRREAVKIPGADFEAEWVSAADTDPQRVILYLPGGAYVIRMPNAHTGMVSRLCRNANAKALMAYYRLAPEHPFPACLEDAVLAYRWLLRQGIEPDPDRLIVSYQIPIHDIDAAVDAFCLRYTKLELLDRGRPVLNHQVGR